MARAPQRQSVMPAVMVRRVGHLRAADPIDDDVHAGARHQARSASRCDGLRPPLTPDTGEQGGWLSGRWLSPGRQEPRTPRAPPNLRTGHEVHQMHASGQGQTTTQSQGKPVSGHRKLPSGGHESQPAGGHERYPLAATVVWADLPANHLTFRRVVQPHSPSVATAPRSPLVAAERGAPARPTRWPIWPPDQPIRPTPRPWGARRPAAASGRERDPSTSPSLVPGCSLRTDQ